MKSRRDISIAVVGAGLGGATAAVLLQRAGFHVTVYEQADAFSKLGAGIHLSPNLVRILDAVGVRDQVESLAAFPPAWISRQWDTGQITFRMTLGKKAVEQFAAPYLTVHRGDFHMTLVSAIARGSVVYGKRLKDLKQGEDKATLHFDDGSCASADLVVGADGLSSMVRAKLYGDDPPLYTGQVVYRATVPVDRLSQPHMYELSKWWAPDHFVITYYLSNSRDTVYLVAGAPEAQWNHPGRWTEADPSELREVFRGFHEPIRELVGNVEAVTKWGLFEREPMTEWGVGCVVLLGDACHPMRPHMAQGAAMAIEDAAVLTSCLQKFGGDWDKVFNRYIGLRRDRTAIVQKLSSENRWLMEPTDPAWLYAYDAWAEGALAA